MRKKVRRFLSWVAVLLVGAALTLVVAPRFQELVRPYSASLAGDLVLLFLALPLGVGALMFVEWVFGGLWFPHTHVVAKPHAIR